MGSCFGKRPSSLSVPGSPRLRQESVPAAVPGNTPAEDMAQLLAGGPLEQPSMLGGHVGSPQGLRGPPSEGVEASRLPLGLAFLCSTRCWLVLGVGVGKLFSSLV